MSTTDLLPPCSTPLERAFAAASARVGDIPIDLAALWDPARCPPNLLPWLAWALSTDNWNANWSLPRKRAAVASAIEDQRHKGSRASVERVVSRFDEAITIVEWFEADPPRDPHTFEVRVPVGDDGHVTANFVREIIADVTATKPVRSHFDLIEELALLAVAYPVCAVQATGYRRLDLAVENTAIFDGGGG